MSMDREESDQTKLLSSKNGCGRSQKVSGDEPNSGCQIFDGVRCCRRQGKGMLFVIDRFRRLYEYMHFQLHIVCVG